MVLLIGYCIYSDRLLCSCAVSGEGHVISIHHEYRQRSFMCVEKLCMPKLLMVEIDPILRWQCKSLPRPQKAHISAEAYIASFLAA